MNEYKISAQFKRRQTTEVCGNFTISIEAESEREARQKLGQMRLTNSEQDFVLEIKEENFLSQGPVVLDFDTIKINNEQSEPQPVIFLNSRCCD
jgi:hypothetical protein